MDHPGKANDRLLKDQMAFGSCSKQSQQVEKLSDVLLSVAKPSLFNAFFLDRVWMR
jgi:hypothetical protein